jgi:SAM-dependent methyltransferase
LKTVKEIHEYWKNPDDDKNNPLDYFRGKKKTEYLVKVMNFVAEKDAEICELGCNVGRNLSGLYHDGFEKLYGTDINENAINKIDDEIFYEIDVEIDSIESYTETIIDKCFDVTFSMAALCHIHHDVIGDVLKNIIRITRGFIITIEDEKTISSRHFPRKYKDEFKKLGIEQVCEESCKKIPRLGKKYYLRIFKI